MILRTNSYIFDVVIVNCMTAGSRVKMVAQNSEWLLCDVMKRHNGHVIIPICQANDVLKTYQVSSQECDYFSRSIGGHFAQKLQKRPGKIGLRTYNESIS